MKKSKQQNIVIRLDRVRFSTADITRPPLHELPWFLCDYDYRLSRSRDGQGPLYGRVARFRNTRTGMQVEVQYCSLRPWLPECLVVLVANDSTGLSRQEVEEVENMLIDPKLSMVEIAVDFPDK